MTVSILSSIKSNSKLLYLLFLTIFSFFNFKINAQDVSIKGVVSFGIEKMEKKEITLRIVLAIENQTNHGAGVKIKNGYFYKDGERYGSFTLMNKVRVKKKSNENVPVLLKVKLEKEIQLLQEGLNMLFGKSPEIMVSGVLKATNFIFSKKYPFNYKQELSFNNWME